MRRELERFVGLEEWKQNWSLNGSRTGKIFLVLKEWKQNLQSLHQPWPTPSGAEASS